MRLSMLGPIEIDGREIGSPQERRLLAALLLHRNRTVPVAAVEEAIWGEAAPTASRASLHSKVSRLRSLVGADRLAHGPAGYSLTLRDGECDADAFETMARQLSSAMDAAPATRIDLADRALGLWRGRLLGELADEGFVGGEAVRYDQLRSSVAEARTVALIDAGRYDDALVDLETLAHENPYHDRLCELRMTALARLGRTVEALRAFSEYQRRLADDVGVSPTSRLADVEGRILRGELGPDGVMGRHAPPPPGTLTERGADIGDRGALHGARWNAPIVMRPTLVGREDAVAVLRRSLQHAAGVECCVVEGDAGMGKSRLAIEAIALARRSGSATKVLACQPPPARAFAAFDTLGRGDGATSDPADADDDSSSWSDVHARHRVVASHADSLCRSLGSRSLLVVEDLHWVDDGTLEVLLSAVSRLVESDATCTLLVTSRSLRSAPARSGAVTRLLRELPTTTVHLGGLSEPEVFQLIERATDAVPHAQLADLLFDHGAGNPLLALTGLQSMRTSGDLHYDGRSLQSSASSFRTVPFDLSGSLDRIVEELDPRTQRLLEQLALSGGPIEIDGLPALAGLPASEVAAAIAPAEIAGLVESGDGTVAFRHELYARIVEERVPMAERATHHAELFERLLPCAMADADRERFDALGSALLARLAHHGSAAGRLIPAPVRYAVFRAAGARWLSETDWASAARAHRAALALAGPAGISEAELFELEAHAGAALFRAHDTEDAIALLERVGARAQASGALEAWASALADHERAAFLLKVAPRPDRTRIERFVEAASATRPDLCARLLALSAEQHVSHGDQDAARSLIRRAHALAPSELRPLNEAELLFASGLTALGELRLTEAEDLFTRSIVAARRAGSAWVMSWGLGRIAFVRLLTGDVDRTAAAIREARAVQLEASSWGELSFTAAVAAHLADLKGDDIAADAAISESERLLHRSGFAFTALFLYPLMIQRAVRTDDASSAAAALGAWAQQAGRVPRIFRVLQLASSNRDAAFSELIGWRAITGGQLGPGHLAALAAQLVVAERLGDDALLAHTASALGVLGQLGVAYLLGVGIALDKRITVS